MSILDVKESRPKNRMAKHFDLAYLKSLSEDQQKLLLLCCKSGYENSDSGMGLYAMSPTDYDEFKEYFDKVRTPNRPIPYLRMQREVLRVLLFTAFQNRVSWSMKPLRSY